MGNIDIFEMIASSYDTSERTEIAKLAANAIRERLVNATTKDAIDFGCGTGLVGMYLLNDFQSVLFLDASQNMVKQIQQKITEFDIQNASTLCVDIENESTKNLQVDCIFMAQVLLHIENTEFVLSKLYEMLKADGHLFIVDFDKNGNIASDMVHNGFEQKRLAELLAKIGYNNIQSKTFYYGEKIFMAQDASMFILDCKK
ncbi:class I SAM-dependent methyltransferase [Metasolibacillus fluoroglycofenilyticus]|uniref:class I SAM-dependent methyltransferase n=1 Tax=Metasolibacillus fluoroglycofenilyticus TaxID=1239396 RepID=UPI000D364ED5|nr:class I SAM-dependent methyltransferase [Metasolibacillus fluoroglycofenilyticus]